MNITNKYNLPASIYDALKGRDFNLTDTPENIFWLTKLISSPMFAVLERRHWAELEEDVSDKVFRIMGQGVHSIVEQFQDGSQRLSEEKAYVDIENMEVHTLPLKAKLTEQKWYSSDKFFLSLRLDCYDGADKFVEDYKVTTAWQVIIEGKPKEEWIAQNSIAAWILRKIGFDVLGMRNILFLRDWQKSKVGTDPKYPSIPIHIYSLSGFWSNELTEAYIRERIKLHCKAMALPDEKIIPCTVEERWGKKEVWAVMKVGRKTAIKLYDSPTTANEHIGTDKDLYIEHRPGQDVKCDSYCSVNSFCPYYKTKKGK